MTEPTTEQATPEPTPQTPADDAGGTTEPTQEDIDRGYLTESTHARAKRILKDWQSKTDEPAAEEKTEVNEPGKVEATEAREASQEPSEVDKLKAQLATLQQQVQTGGEIGERLAAVEARETAYKDLQGRAQTAVDDQNLMGFLDSLGFDSEKALLKQTAEKDPDRERMISLIQEAMEPMQAENKALKDELTSFRTEQGSLRKQDAVSSEKTLIAETYGAHAAKYTYLSAYMTQPQDVVEEVFATAVELYKKRKAEGDPNPKVDYLQVMSSIDQGFKAQHEQASKQINGASDGAGSQAATESPAADAPQTSTTTLTNSAASEHGDKPLFHMDKIQERQRIAALLRNHAKRG